MKITYTLSIFGHKIDYNCHSEVNIQLSHIFFSVYKHRLYICIYILCVYYSVVFNTCYGQQSGVCVCVCVCVCAKG